MLSMNRFSESLSALAAIFLLATPVAQAAPQPDWPVTIKVISLKGSARFSPDQKDWIPLKQGNALNPGCVIQTADKSTVTLQFIPPGTRPPEPRLDAKHLLNNKKPLSDGLSILPNTVLTVEKASVRSGTSGVVTQTSLNLGVGDIIGSVSDVSPESIYEIKLPMGIAGARPNSAYTLSSSGRADTLRGTVVLAIPSADGNVATKVIAAGSWFDPASGQIARIPQSEESTLPSHPTPSPTLSPARPPGAPMGIERKF